MTWLVKRKTTRGGVIKTRLLLMIIQRCAFKKTLLRSIDTNSFEKQFFRNTLFRDPFGMTWSVKRKSTRGGVIKTRLLNCCFQTESN